MKKKLALVFLFLGQLAFARIATDDSMNAELLGVLSYLGVLLLSFLFILVVVIPFISEVTDRRKLHPLRGPLTSGLVLALEFFVGVLVILLALPDSAAGDVNRTEALVYIISAICATLPFFVFLLIVFVSNMYKNNLFNNVFPMLLWGVTASSAALVVNQFFESILTSLYSHPEVTLLVLAVFFEEALKGIGLLEFMKHRIPPTPLALLYGFSIGVGFSVIENWLYFSYVTTPDVLGVRNWTHVLFYRSFFTNLAHGFFTASNAFVVCRVKSNFRFIAGLLAAFALHLTYNVLTISGFSAVTPFFVIGMACAFIYVVYSNTSPGARSRKLAGLIKPRTNRK